LFFANLAFGLLPLRALAAASAPSTAIPRAMPHVQVPY
jgi:hypothetical protein